MGKCLCNPEIETSMVCMKDQVYLCEDCLSCRNPEIYCKYRTACPIWFNQKHGGDGGAAQAADKEAEAVTPEERDPYQVTFPTD